MKVVVLYNPPTLPIDHPDAGSEADVVAVAQHVEGVLRGRGWSTQMVEATGTVSELARRLEGLKTDVVFNLVEAFAGTSAGEAWISSLLELLRLPYTGAPPEAQGLCRSKTRTKLLLLGAGLPTASFQTWSDLSQGTLDGLDYPLIVKPEAEDASLGIAQRSVVSSQAELVERVAELAGAYGDALMVETYLPGREFNVGILDLVEPISLAPAELRFTTQGMKWPILTYDAKWLDGSAEDLASPVQVPAEVDPLLAAELAKLAIRAYRVTGCRDYARVDFRLDDRGRPFILEVNPNPDIGPKAGWARALAASGRDYGATLDALAHRARQRGSVDE